MRRSVLVTCFIMLAVAGLGWHIFGGAGLPSTNAQAKSQLNATGFALVSDPGRQQLYVSVPDSNEVDVLSMGTLEVTSRVVFGGQRPMGMSLSLDGSKLFVALNSGGAVGIVDLPSLATRTIDVSVALGDSRVWDVVEGRPNRLYVSANPGSSGLSWLAQIALDQGDLVTRFPSGGIIRAAPIFLPSPDHQLLYVGESAFSPQALHKFDISTDSPALLADAPFGSVAGMQSLDISGDGTRIYTASGQVLRTDTLTQVGASAPGTPRVSADSSKLYVGSGTTVYEFDRAALIELDQHASPCNISRLALSTNATELFALGSDGVCRISLLPATPTPTATATPTPGPVNVQAGRSGNVRGLFGTVNFPDAPRSGGNVSFARPLDSSDYAVLLTPENRACVPAVTAKTPTGFSFSCSGSGGAVDWAVLEPSGGDR